MYDYVKMYIYDPDLVVALKKHPLLNFSGVFNLRTSEAGDSFIAKYQGLEFTIHPSNRIQIQGSFHKYFNNGCHNFNDFAFKDVVETIERLKLEFQIDPEKWRIEHIEFGFNLSTPFPPSVVLRSLVVFKNVPFDRMEIRGRGEGKRAVLNQYLVKIYNKGLQYNTPDNILRFERKVRKMENLRPSPVYLNDLLDRNFFIKCQQILVETWNCVLLVEKVNMKSLKKKEQDVYQTCINPGKWEAMNPKQRLTHRLKYASIIAEHCKASLKSCITELIDTKRHLLLDNGNVLTDLLQNE
jgi:hypothetical protein